MLSPTLNLIICALCATVSLIVAAYHIGYNRGRHAERVHLLTLILTQNHTENNHE